MTETNEVAHGHEIPAPVSPAEFLGAKEVLAGVHFQAPLFKDENITFFFKGKTDPVTKELIPGSKRANVDLVVPALTFEGLVSKLTHGDDKIKNYILDQVNQAIREGAKLQVNDKEKPVNRQSELDIEKLTIEYLAYIPPSERAGSGISDETWEDWAQDYLNTMTQHTNQSVEKIKLAIELFVTKLKKTKENKNALQFLSDRLNVWAGASTRAQEFADVYTYLDSLIEKYINKDNQDLMDALQ